MAETPARSLQAARQWAVAAWDRSVPGRQIRDAYRAAQTRGGRLTIPGAMGWSMFASGWVFWALACPGLGRTLLQGTFYGLALFFWAAGLAFIAIHWNLQLREWKERLNAPGRD